MKFTDLFIKRPVLATVISLFILVLGLSSLDSLPIQQYPFTQSAVITFTKVYTGADPKVVAGFITTPLENSIAQANGIDYMTSIGPANDSARNANTPYIQNYSAFRLGNFKRDTVMMAVVMLPAASNIHMPEEMRPKADLFVAVPERALYNANSNAQRPRISRGPRWKSLREAKIIKPDDLFATYELAADSNAKAAMMRTMSESEYDQVVFRSNETNWPDGINTFDERYPKLADFKKYKAYASAKWDDKILVIVPGEKNKKMPALLRPYVDLYFIYSKSAVEVKEKKKKK